MVKLSPPSKTMNEWYEGSTAEEAVDRARQSLGNDAPVRCWKVRRGGLFGFFATEVYVAGIEAPKEVGRAHASGPTTVSSLDDDSVSLNESMTDDLEPSRPAANAPASIAALVEATSDEVTIGRSNIFESAFIDVLTQAQEALNGRKANIEEPSEEVRAVSPHPAFGEPLERRHTPEHVQGLRALAADFGLPSDYWPDNADATLNDLMAVLDRLPAPRPVPCDEGTLIVVVGATGDAISTARRLVQILGLAESDLIEGECSVASQQRILRIRRTHVSVVTIEWPTRHVERASVAAWIDLLDPDYVIAAVSATSKRADVRDWCHQLTHVNALSLTRTSETTSPGELLGDFPILLVDGHLASTLRWVSMLLGVALERQ